MNNDISIFLVLFKIAKLLVFLLLGATYLVYLERKIMAFMQLRIGPNVVGPFGLLQPIADTVKLLFKEFIIPKNVSKFAFLTPPVLVFSLSLVGWAAIPIDIKLNKETMTYSVSAISNLNMGVIYLIAISSLSVYGIIIAGWASNSRYALIGGMRAAAQIISYELVMSTCILCVIVCTGSLNITEITTRMHFLPIWIKIMLIPIAIIFFIANLAETKRHPFDTPEAESELVAGFNVEYSSLPFAMFFFGEYLNMILCSAIITLLFMGGWYPIFNIKILYLVPGMVWIMIKILFVLFCFIWIRSTLPRYRYDQLMSLCWKKLFPISFSWTMLIAFLLIKNNIFPQ